MTITLTVKKTEGLNTLEQIINRTGNRCVNESKIMETNKERDLGQTGTGKTN